MFQQGHFHYHSRYFPVVDGVFLTAQPNQLLAAGSMNAISAAIVGSNSNEAALFGCRRWPGATPAMLDSMLVGFFGPTLAPLVEAQYPASNYYSPTANLNAIFSDMPYRCGMKNMADLLIQNGVPTYMYSFIDETNLASSQCYGAAHSFELPYLFPNLVPYYVAEFGGTAFNAQQTALSVFMLQSWATFIATGNPNERGDSEWPHYGKNAPYVELSNVLNPVPQGTNFGEGNCAFWLANPCQPDAPGFTCQFNATYPTPTVNGDGDGLSDGAIAGIVIGSTIGAFIVVLSLVIIGILILLRRRYTQNKNAAYKLMKEEG